MRQRLDTAEEELAAARQRSRHEEQKLLNALYNALRDYQTWTAARLGNTSFVFHELPHGPEMMIVPAMALEHESFFQEDGDGEVKPAPSPPSRRMTRPFAVGTGPLTQAEWARCEKAGACPHRADAARTDSEDGWIKWMQFGEADAYARWLNKEIKRKTGRPGRYRPMTQDEKEMLMDIGALLKIDSGMVLSGMGWLMGYAQDRLALDLPLDPV
ncbi:MAG: hypothetical protein BWK76_04150 [Desulfobulbaceae bacterium A2]|nr:MAG: hypothetical protein BWK76_04150 [Desulfobulbaceae bacterium A2]